MPNKSENAIQRANRHYAFDSRLNITFFFSHHDVTPITMALNGASSSPSACQALASMLSRNTLNPADISVLFRNYSTMEPPPIELLRNPQFLGNDQHVFVRV